MFPGASAAEVAHIQVKAWEITEPPKIYAWETEVEKIYTD